VEDIMDVSILAGVAVAAVAGAVIALNTWRERRALERALVRVPVESGSRHPEHRIRRRR